MRKEEICVLIDSEEKRLRALEILKKAGEEVYVGSLLFKESKEVYYYIGYSRFYGSWKLIPPDRPEVITLDQLEELLLPNYVVKDVHLTIDELKEQAERLGLELVEKKREIKVGDFGVFWDGDKVIQDVIYFDYLTRIEDNFFIDSGGNPFKNFRRLTDEEKEKIQNNW